MTNARYRDLLSSDLGADRQLRDLGHGLAHRHAMARFGQGMKAIEALARSL